MRLAHSLCALVFGLAMQAGALHAQVRTEDPVAHVNQLVDLLETEGGKAFAVAVARALDSNNSAAILPHVSPIEKRKAKFRAIALDRDYGGAIRDIVVYQYRLAEQYPFLYFRFIYKMTDAGWRLTNFQFDSEGAQPIPPKYGLH